MKCISDLNISDVSFRAINEFVRGEIFRCTDKPITCYSAFQSAPRFGQVRWEIKNDSIINCLEAI